MLEGARRVGKTTIAEEFARNEYDSYILIDFSNTSKEMMDIFDDISKLDRFFLRLQMEGKHGTDYLKGIGLIKGAILIYQKGKEKESSFVKVGQNTKGVYKIDGFTQ